MSLVLGRARHSLGRERQSSSSDPLMSAFGTKRTLGSRRSMSAFGVRADITVISAFGLFVERVGLRRPASVSDLYPSFWWFSSAPTLFAVGFRDSGSRNSSSDRPFSLWRSGRTKNMQIKTTTMNAISMLIAAKDASCLTLCTER